MFEIEQTATQLQGAKIKVVGVGGGGGNAVNTMIQSGLKGVEFILANTDQQSLVINEADVRIQIGSDATKGLGAGSNPDVGRRAAMEDHQKLAEIIEGADMLFVTAGMGGGTGTGAAPVIANIAKEMGILTVGVVTKPFSFEGKRRMRYAEAGIAALKDEVDSLITIPNQRLLYVAGEGLSMLDTFKVADRVLLNAVQGISDLIMNTGLVNCDFADVRTIMQNKGLALMGTGKAEGTNRAMEAANQAISSPLLEDVSIDGATGIIINITGGKDLTTHEVNEATTLVMEAAHEDAEIIFGTVIDEEMGDLVKVTVIATGLGNLSKTAPMEEPLSAKYEQSSLSQRLSPAEEVLMKETEVLQEQMRETPQIEVINEPVAREPQTSFTFDPSSMNVQEEIGREREERQEETRREVLRHEELSESQIEKKQKASEISKARTIAEKLGIFNFSEEDFDTPAFLRKRTPEKEVQN